MTLLSALGFQPRKRMEMIAPTSISYTDISIVIPVKNNQKGITLFLSEFVKTHSPALYPREIIIVDNASQPRVIIPKASAERSLNITILSCDAPGPACARNLGILHAQSEWILFTDSDCVPSSTFLSGYVAAVNDLRSETGGLCLPLDSTATRHIFADVPLWLLCPMHQG